MAGQIVVVGSLNMDLVVRALRHPAPGETILGSDFRTFPGGKGANQAVAAARLGGFVQMIGRVGADDFGAALLGNLAANGVDSQYVLADEEVATGVALITVSDVGQNTIVVASGANWRLSPADIVDAQEAFTQANLLMLQLEIPLPAVERAIATARRHALPIILNPAPARSLDRELLAQVDYLTPNQGELALLAGSADVEAGVRNVIVTLGEDGVLVVGETLRAHLPAHQVPVVDTTAAGDAFVGGFAVALVHGLPLLDAVRWGNAAGALAVTRAGAQPALPTRAEIDALLAQSGTH